MNVKSNGNKSQLFVLDAESFFTGMFTGSWLTIVITAALYSVAEIARASGLENIVDSNHVQIVRAVEYGNTIGMMSGEDILKMDMVW
jgi:hypothetical protein